MTRVVWLIHTRFLWFLRFSLIQYYLYGRPQNLKETKLPNSFDEDDHQMQLSWARPFGRDQKHVWSLFPCIRCDLCVSIVYCVKRSHGLVTSIPQLWRFTMGLSKEILNSALLVIILNEGTHRLTNVLLDLNKQPTLLVYPMKQQIKVIKKGRKRFPRWAD